MRNLYIIEKKYGRNFLWEAKQFVQRRNMGEIFHEN